MHNFKKIAIPVVFILVIVSMNGILMQALKPYNYFRNDVHNLETNQYQDLFVGSSHGKAGIQPEVVDEVTGRTSANLCLGGQYPIDSYFLIKEACRKNKPERVIYELDPGYWTSKASLGPDYATVYEELPWSAVKWEYLVAKMWDVDFRETLFPWYVYRQGYRSAFDVFKGRMSKAYLSYEDSFYDNPVQSYGNHGAVNIHRIEGIEKTEENLGLWDEEKLERESVEYFEKLRQLCEEKGIELLVITTPIPTETLEKYSGKFQLAYDFFEQYMKERKIPYYNFNTIEIEGFDRTLNGFTDYEGHMFEDQAEIFSRTLGEYLSK